MSDEDKEDLSRISAFVKQADHMARRLYEKLGDDVDWLMEVQESLHYTNEDCKRMVSHLE